MPPSVVFNTDPGLDVAQEQIARIRLANHAFQASQGQIDRHSITARAAGSGSDNHSGPLIVVLIALASLVAILVIGSSILLIRYRRVIGGTCTHTTRCLTPANATKSRWLHRLGARTTQQVDPQYVIHQGEGGTIHCRTPPPADLKSILLEPTSTSNESKELPEGLEAQLPRTPPRYRIPSIALDPTECSISTIPRQPDNSMARSSLDHSAFSRGSLDRASSADAQPLSEESIQGWMAGRPSIDSSTCPRTPTEYEGTIVKRPIHSPKKSAMDKHGVSSRRLSATKMARQASSSSTTTHTSTPMSSNPSFLRMIRSVSSTLSFSSKNIDATEDMVLDINASNKSHIDVLFGTWRPPSIIISPPTNSTLVHRNSLTSEGFGNPHPREKADEQMWQTSTPRRPSRSTRRMSVQRRIST